MGCQRDRSWWPCHWHTPGALGREQSGFIVTSRRNKPWLDWPRQTLACPPTYRKGQRRRGQAKGWLSCAEPLPFPSADEALLFRYAATSRPGSHSFCWRCQDFRFGLASPIWMGVTSGGRQADAWRGLPCRQDATPRRWPRPPFSLALGKPVVHRAAEPGPCCSADGGINCGCSIRCRELKSIKQQSWQSFSQSRCCL